MRKETILSLAKKGLACPEIEIVAKVENIHIDDLIELIAKGLVVIPANILKSEREIISYDRLDFSKLNKQFIPCGIGKNLFTKVNVNIGTSPDIIDLELEKKKVLISLKYRADTIMDLSTGGNLDKVRQKILDFTPIPLGTVPLYQVAKEAEEKYGCSYKATVDDIFNVIERHAKDGVDFMTIHAGVTLRSLELLEKDNRLMGIVSRGGALIAEWMIYNERENPLYENFDRLLEIAKKYDITISLGDGLRPGCIKDATDKPQIEELITLGELVDICRENNVQVMVEGPGHVPLNMIKTNMEIQKSLCKGAPFYVLGPIVTDIAPGYDHITSAIGGALAATFGADFLCYVTPAEHLGLPDENDVKEGLIASKIAAHAADLAKGKKEAWEKDIKMAIARDSLDWDTQFKLAIDPEKAKLYREKKAPKKDKDVCSMCSNFCPVKKLKEAWEKKRD